MSTLTRLAGDLQSGHVFTVEKIEEGEFQSVFPEALADQSSLHPTEAAAWLYIAERIMEGTPDEE